ncbi:hypothetical protein CDO26_24875 (plasmid) [Sinorhizobium meliloti]|nr:hypothetical protein CDO26_24875 [Sinorhizobium meliloti]ASP93717.1 hypothetical protein CDO25_21715 [Sinorhizobium meliloti]MQW24814.1 hypothetical protein [Sinorhizobium meliloti]MQX56401.1 hypothetical protein [Sinorhizobium meliloti]RVG87365.1 hypothetical protein CN219_07190 [Sinorhizobium meliloti]
MSEMVHHRRMAIAAVEQLRRSDNVSVGESFDKNGWRFEVVDLDGRRIDKRLVRPEQSDRTDKTQAA